MAFHISKQGNPEVLLTDGGSLLLGTGLSIDNGTLNVTGGGGTTPSFSDITGNPEDNEKLAIILDNCVKKDDADLVKLINGENENYLRHSVEGLVISSSLNDLNSRILDSDSNIEELLAKVSDLAELSEVVTSLEERVTNIELSSDEELVISSALNDLNDRLLVVEQKLATI